MSFNNDGYRGGFAECHVSLFSKKLSNFCNQCSDKHKNFLDQRNRRSVIFKFLNITQLSHEQIFHNHRVQRSTSSNLLVGFTQLFDRHDKKSSETSSAMEQPARARLSKIYCCVRISFKFQMSDCKGNLYSCLCISDDDDCIYYYRQ